MRNLYLNEIFKLTWNCVRDRIYFIYSLQRICEFIR